MIPDEEERDPVIDFTWYYFIGRNKLHLTYRQVGRLTLTTFNKLYQHYKDDFDLEMLLKKTNTTYKDLYSKKEQEQEWF